MRETPFHLLAALLLRVWSGDRPPAAGALPGSWLEIEVFHIPVVIFHTQHIEGVAYTLKLEQLPQENLS